MKRFFEDKKSRRHFLKITAKSSIALPFLSSLSSIETLAQGAPQLPWLIFCPLPNAIHPLNFFPRLENINGWSNVGNDPRVKARNFDFAGTGDISPVFHNQLPFYNEIKQYLTMVAGTGWGYNHSEHDYTNGSTLWSTAGFGAPVPGVTNKTGTVDLKIRELVNQDYGNNTCNILNCSYASAGGGRDNQGKVSSHSDSGVASQAITKLNLLLDAIGGTNSGGGSTGGNSGGGSGGSPTPTPGPNLFDRSKFIDAALGFITPFRTSSRLSTTDKNTLEAYQDRLSEIKSALQMNVIVGPNISIPQGLGSVNGLNDLIQVTDMQLYLTTWRKILAAAITTGSHQIINIGNFSPILNNLSNGIWTPSNHHDTSHDWNTVDSPIQGSVQKDYSIGIMRHIIFPLMKEIMSTPHPSGGNWADQGAIYSAYEHATGNFHGAYQGSEDKKTYGLATAILGKLKNYFRGNQIYDFREFNSRPNQSSHVALAFNHMFNVTFFKAFGITNPSRYATQGGDTYGFYEDTCGNNCWGSAYSEDSKKFRNRVFPKL
jgi:hypothetical protein